MTALAMTNLLSFFLGGGGGGTTSEYRRVLVAMPKLSICERHQGVTQDMTTGEEQ